MRLPSDSDRANALAEARRLIAAGSVAYEYNKVQRDLRELGFLRDREVRSVLLQVLDNELAPPHYNGGSPVPEKSWELGFEHCDVWQFAWTSARLGGRDMFVKFCFHEGRLHLMSFHESTRKKPSSSGGTE